MVGWMLGRGTVSYFLSEDRREREKEGEGGEGERGRREREEEGRERKKKDETGRRMMNFIPGGTLSDPCLSIPFRSHSLFSSKTLAQTALKRLEARPEGAKVRSC